MAPAHRTARIAISVVALTWLGIVFGLLLWIAASIAGAPYGP
jgi:type IV secretory pathway TrbD component